MPSRISRIVRRAVILSGRRTSISIEDQFWHALKEIAVARGETLGQTLRAAASQEPGGNLSSSARVFVLKHLMEEVRRGPERKSSARTDTDRAAAV